LKLAEKMTVLVLESFSHGVMIVSKACNEASHGLNHGYAATLKQLVSGKEIQPVSPFKLNRGSLGSSFSANRFRIGRG